MSALVFAILAPVIILSALSVVFLTNPIGSALSLIVTLSSLAILYFQLSAPLVGILQILLYSGAIMVLFIFVIMLINLQPGEMERLRLRPSMIALFTLMIAFVGSIGSVVWTVAQLDITSPAVIQPDFGSIPRLGAMLLSEYGVPFELISFVILTAVIGAVVLVRKKSGGHE